MICTRMREMNDLTLMFFSALVVYLMNILFA